MRPVLLAAALILGWSASTAFAQEPSSLYKAAEKEGKAVYWGAPDVDVLTAMKDEFGRRYPGVGLDMFKLQPAPAIERIVGAASAGRLEVDFIDTPISYLPLLFRRNLAEPFPWTQTLGTDPDRVLFDGRAVAVWDIDFPIAINSSLVKPGEIKSWEDLADPKWRGKVILDARGLAFATLALKWGEEKTFGLLSRIVANEPVILKGSTAEVEALAGGQGAIAVGPYGGFVLQSKRDGAPVDVALVGPVPAMIEAAAVIKGGPHPNAARLWINFLIGPEGQKFLYAGRGLGMVHLKPLSPIGQMYKDAGLEVVMDTPDAEAMQKLVSKASAIIGVLQ